MSLFNRKPKAEDGSLESYIERFGECDGERFWKQYQTSIKQMEYYKAVTGNTMPCSGSMYDYPSNTVIDVTPKKIDQLKSLNDWEFDNAENY